jgi:c-di-GMP-binding flagellar brake protein YcgR
MSTKTGMITGATAGDAIPIRMGVGAGRGRAGDRRQFARVDVSKPCKVFRAATCRYTSAVTRDVSAGGVLLEIAASRPIVAGEKLGVGVAWTGGVVLSEAAMVEGTVVRVEDVGEDRQAVAVRFARAGEGVVGVAA